MSRHDRLFARTAAPRHRRFHGTAEAVVLVGLGPDGDDLPVDATVGDVTVRRETLEEGSSEQRERVESLTVRLMTSPDVQLSTPVIVPQYGSTVWTVEEIVSHDELPELRLFRAYDMARQSGRLEFGQR